MMKIKLTLSVVCCLFIASCLTTPQEHNSIQKMGFVGNDGGAFTPTTDTLSLVNWLKFCELHASKSIDEMMDLCGDSILVELRDGEMIQGKEAFRQGLQNWMKDADVSINQYYGIPMQFVNSSDSINPGILIVTGHELVVQTGKNVHKEENHLNVFMADGLIQYMQVFTHKMSDQEEVELTFSVDLSQYEGAYKSVGVFGSFNDWCGTCNPLTDDDGDQVYQGTVSVTTGEIEYKFILDEQAVEETFEPGAACTKTTDIYTNRWIDINTELILPVVCFNSCSPCK